MQSIFEKMGGTYSKNGDYYIPNLKLDVDTSNEDKPIGKYGLLRESYLKENRTGLYNNLLLTGKLTSHLLDIDEQSQRMLDTIIPQMAKQENVTEKLKTADQMEWVCRMNNIKARVEEIIFSEIVYS